jgi:ribosomal protein L32E
MQNTSDRKKTLNQLYQICRVGMEASELILPETTGWGLRSQIKKQDENYINTSEKAAAMIKLQGTEPHSISNVTRRMMRGSIKINTFFHHSPQRISEMMINGSVMGIISMTKTMNHLEDCDLETKRLAENYVETEKQNIQALKQYL